MSKKFDNPLPQNELGGAVFFQKRINQPLTTSKPDITSTKRVSSQPEPERTENRTEIRTVAPSPLPTKRLSRRYSFEFYDDQITRLKELKHQADLRGEKLTLSDVARKALDDYLDRVTPETERKSERTD